MGPAARIFANLALLLAVGYAWSGTSMRTDVLRASSSLRDTLAAEASDNSSAVSRDLHFPSYREQAPLALFSLGSLAVGGVFYGIHASMRGSNGGYTSGDGKKLTSAVGMAGLTALLAAGSYFYFAKKAEEAPSAWDASLTGSVSEDGRPGIGALITLPLPAFSR